MCWMSQNAHCLGSVGNVLLIPCFWWKYFLSYKGIGADNLAQIKSPASELCNAQVCLVKIIKASTYMTAEKETVQWWRYGKIRTCLVPEIVACWLLMVSFAFGKYIYCTSGRHNLQSFLAANLTHIILIVGQFSTGQFGTGQFGTNIIKRTIWHQDNKNGQFGTRTIWHQDNLALDNLAPGQFGTKFFGPLFRSAFFVNKKSLFLQKCQCIELLTVF